MNRSVYQSVVEQILDKDNKSVIQDRIINQSTLGDVKRQHMQESRILMDEIQNRKMQEEEEEQNGLYKKQLKKDRGERYVDLLHHVNERLKHLHSFLSEQTVKNYTLDYSIKYKENCVVLKNAYKILGEQNKKIVDQSVHVQEIQKDLLDYSTQLQKKLTNLKKDCNIHIKKLRQLDDIQDQISYIDSNNFIIKDMHDRATHGISELTEIQKLRMRINIAFEHSVALNNKLIKLQQIAAFLNKKHKQNIQQSPNELNNINTPQYNMKQQNKGITIDLFMNKYMKKDA